MSNYMKQRTRQLMTGMHFSKRGDENCISPRFAIEEQGAAVTVRMCTIILGSPNIQMWRRDFPLFSRIENTFQFYLYTSPRLEMRSRRGRLPQDVAQPSLVGGYHLRWPS